jgi:S-adenosylmethionine synthetase
MTSSKRLRTSESVTEGHPDKIADRISDAVLDAVLSGDRDAHVACETFLTTGLVVVGGEISTRTYVDVPTLVRGVLSEIGYDRPELGFHFQDCAVLSAIKEQSPNINDAVRTSLERRETRSKDPRDALGAGDQGIVFGHAKSDTETLMPLPIHLAHRLAQRLAAVRKDKTVPFLRPDGKTQVTVEYDGERPIRVDTVLLAAQHEPDATREMIERELLEHVIRPVLGPWLDAKTRILINTSGRFEIGGPASDSGMTGRKIIADTYGGFAPHGGGAFSGKDPTKVDRSGAYMARKVAKNLVAAKLARVVDVEIAYAIGRAEPLAVNINSLGTGAVPDEQLQAIVRDVFDLRPKAIIDGLRLLDQRYEPLSAYGHFGRDDLDLTWEETDAIPALQRAAR